MNSKIFKAWTPDPIGQILGTRFNRFVAYCGLDGLARENGERLDILAVHSTNPGNGQFRAFMEQCKSTYSTICIWHIDNPFLKGVLQRYGFSNEVEVSGLADGETLIGMRWDR